MYTVPVENDYMQNSPKILIRYVMHKVKGTAILKSLLLWYLVYFQSGKKIQSKQSLVNYLKEIKNQ